LVGIIAGMRRFVFGAVYAKILLAEEGSVLRRDCWGLTLAEKVLRLSGDNHEFPNRVTDRVAPSGLGARAVGRADQNGAVFVFEAPG